LEILLRIYKDSHAMLQPTITQGEEVIGTIGKEFHLSN
jgi:hypothetical protein